jgi:hypothetical protein
MESRRLVVWISAGILGFQGATLAFDLLHCTVLSWIFVREHGLGAPRGQGAAGQGQAAEGSGPAQSPAPPPTVSVFDPTGVFCEQPHKRIDAAVGQGLTILAGLALGSSVGRDGSGPDRNP